MNEKKNGIILQFDLDGFHHYPDAPFGVEFLRHSHRHLFRFKIFFKVSHHNRDLEFFITSAQVKAFLIETFGTGVGIGTPLEFGAMSCEQIADRVLDEYVSRGCFRVEVWEDGENGGFVEREPIRFL